MKDISDDVSKYGDITYMVPSGCNNAFINKIKDINFRLNVIVKFVNLIFVNS